MKIVNLFSYTLVAGALAVAGLANAAPTPKFQDFTVAPNGLPGVTGITSFTSNDIGGTYTENVTLNLDGTFTASLLFNASSFNEDYLLPDPSVQLTGTGINSAYQLYALFSGAGTYSLSSGGASFTLASGVIDVYGHTGTNQTFTTSGNNFAAVLAGDTHLATGTAVSGQGQQIDLSNNLFGFFSQTTTFKLTSDGSNFFTAPSPFYALSFQTGQVNGPAFTAGATTNVTGSADVTFRVPEPGTVALLGMGLFALGIAGRRRSSR
jgi:hypothetical protein